VFFLGLHFVHPPGAHTYWKYPGIVGLATQIDWELPPGFSAGEIQWPAPEVVKMASYKAQGYEGETLLMIPLTAAPDISSDEPVTLSARVSWMCCGKTCKPAAEIPFAITLPVSDAADPDPGTLPLFAKFRAVVPLTDPQWHVAAKREAEQIILTLAPPANFGELPDSSRIHFFTADGQVGSNQKQQVKVFPDGKILMKLPVAETAPRHSEALPGVVELRKGSEPFQLEINPRY
jgi:thiol:disulfide interchange protein DsbD